MAERASVVDASAAPAVECVPRRRDPSTPDLQARTLQLGAQHWSFRSSRADGARPWLLLLHGTGSSAATWDAMLPALAGHFNLLAPDLPGHAGSRAARGADASLPGMASAVRALLGALQIEPALIVGHSAGVAIALRLVIDGLAPVRAVVGLNSALMPPSGVRGRVFSPLARLLALSPWVPRLFAWRAADPAFARRLLHTTGSSLDAAGLARYQRLIADPAHAAGALAMMAAWDLEPLVRDLPRLTVPLHLIVAEGDRTVAPAESQQVCARVPVASLARLPGLGHLAHEERPELAAAGVLQAARAAGLIASV